MAGRMWQKFRKGPVERISPRYQAKNSSALTEGAANFNSRPNTSILPSTLKSIPEKQRHSIVHSNGVNRYACYRDFKIGLEEGNFFWIPILDAFVICF